MGDLYDITGTLAPDATGRYGEVGTNNGNDYFTRIDHAYYIYFSLFANRWYIYTDTSDIVTGQNWQTDLGGGITDTFSPASGATGTPTLTQATSLINTENKRRAALRSILPVPDGSIDVNDRRHAIRIYTVTIARAGTFELAESQVYGDGATRAEIDVDGVDESDVYLEGRIR